MRFFWRGVLSVPLGAVWHAYFPELVDPDQMAMANGWISFGSSLASLVGPGLAGRAKGSSAPMALLADSVSYLAVVSGLFRIRHTDVRYPDRSLEIQGVTEIVQSLRVSVANSASRFLTVVIMIPALLSAMFHVLYILYVVRVLHVGIPTYGGLIIVGVMGGLFGSLLPWRVEKYMSTGYLTWMASIGSVGGFAGLPWQSSANRCG